jgi:cell division protease FtsH
MAHQPVPPEAPSWSTTAWRIAIAVALVVAVSLLAGRLAASPGMSYSQFKAAVREGRVTEVSVGPSRLSGTLRGASGAPEAFSTVRVEDPGLLEELTQAGATVNGVEPTAWGEVLAWILPAALVLWLMRNPRGLGASAALGVSQSRARLYAERDVAVRFGDVAGVDEAKEELQEVIRFLKEPGRYRQLGGRMPKGILLVGPPGTGKTLLARAVAGEAGVPFLSISGSEFVEMFVGVGAARVRDLFRQAVQRAPSIIFIDELDALGKVRGPSLVSHDEREQTLNQLLVELDGFDPRAGVVLMAATNRPEILDPALLRAGRFDRHVLVDRPDRLGRLTVLQVHARHVRLASPADLEAIASMTPGMVGADLANLVNEAALLAARRDKQQVERADLEEALERVVAGLEKKNRVLSPREKERVAHHELGHALVALSLPGQPPVRKISVIPRGISALGYTLQLPTEDRFLMTRDELEGKLAVLLGGRAAEQLTFGDVSTGAEDDLARATAIARSMVVSYGMSDAIGPVSLQPVRPLPAEMGSMLPGRDHEHGAEVERVVDAEVRRLLEVALARARSLLVERRELLHGAALELLAHEVLEGERLEAMAAAAGSADGFSPAPH